MQGAFVTNTFKYTCNDDDNDDDDTKLDDDDNGDDGDKTFSLPLQIILKHCGAKKETNTEPTNESPLTAFSLLLSPTRQASTAGSPQRDNSEAPVNLVLPQDLPIDLRVKIVVCLIYLRQLDLVKVMVA